MLVEVEDLQNYIDTRFTPRQRDAATDVLGGLQGELEAFLRRPVEVEEFDEEYVVPHWVSPFPTSTFFYDSSIAEVSNLTNWVPPYTLYIRNSPIQSVESVSVYAPESQTPIVLVEGRDYIVQRYGIDVNRCQHDDRVRVVYTAGLDAQANRLCKLAILRAAAREMQNMHDDVVSIKDLTTRNTGPVVTGFTEAELLTLKRWRRRSV